MFLRWNSPESRVLGSYVPWHLGQFRSWTSRIGVRLPTAELIAQTGAFALRGEASGANSRKEGGEVAPPPGSGESQAQCTIKTQRRGSPLGTYTQMSAVMQF